jgi:hypothetical protein
MTAAVLAFSTWPALLARYAQVQVRLCHTVIDGRNLFDNFVVGDLSWLILLVLLTANIVWSGKVRPGFAAFIVILAAVLGIWLTLRSGWSAVTGNLTCTQDDD